MRPLRYAKRLADLGDEGALCGRTYSAPRKWKRGKGRITVQMGCCYNYATDKQGRPPGILTDEPVNGLPPMLDDVVDRMVARRIFTSATRPDSCIINLYGPRNSGAILAQFGAIILTCLRLPQVLGGRLHPAAHRPPRLRPPVRHALAAVRAADPLR